MNALRIFAALMFLTACGVSYEEGASDGHQSPVILIYCENGMTPAVVELSQLFESKYRGKIRIHNGDIQTLTGMIERWEQGDIYLPDSYQGFQILHQLKPNRIMDSLFLGYHQLVFTVLKGNPANFNGRINGLSCEDQMVVLANPETSSLGHETWRLLKETGVEKEVSRNLIALAVDNRGVSNTLLNGAATVSIDWLSGYYSNNRREYLDTMHIMGYSRMPEVYAGVLRYSQHPGLAYSFLALLDSDQGREILRKHGIYR